MARKKGAASIFPLFRFVILYSGAVGAADQHSDQPLPKTSRRRCFRSTSLLPQHPHAVAGVFHPSSPSFPAIFLPEHMVYTKCGRCCLPRTRRKGYLRTYLIISLVFDSFARPHCEAAPGPGFRSLQFACLLPHSCLL